MRQAGHRRSVIALSVACAGSFPPALAGCGGIEVTNQTMSPPIVLRRTTTPPDVANDLLEIRIPMDAAFTAFIVDAREELHRRDPAMIEVDQLVLRLGPNTALAFRSLDALFASSVDVALLIDASAHEFPVATGAVNSNGELALVPTFDGGSVPDSDYAQLLEARFTMIARGQASPTFRDYPISTTGAELELELVFAAYE